MAVSIAAAFLRYTHNPIFESSGQRAKKNLTRIVLSRLRVKKSKPRVKKSKPRVKNSNPRVKKWGLAPFFFAENLGVSLFITNFAQLIYKLT